MIKDTSFYEGKGIGRMSAYGVCINIYLEILVPISPTYVVSTSLPHPF